MEMVTNMGSSGQMNGMENGRGGGGRGNRQNGFEKTMVKNQRDHQVTGQELKMEKFR